MRILLVEDEAPLRETLAAPKQGERGEHDYAFEDLGLDRSAERVRFRRYQQHFEVPDEL